MAAKLLVRCNVPDIFSDHEYAQKITCTDVFDRQKI